MPRTDDAKNWQPSASDQNLIDRMTEYLILADRCLMKLRDDKFHVKTLWLELQAVFQSDPVKYPSAMAAQNDANGRRDFLAKCQAICFPPPSMVPHSPEDYILMYFSAVASLQCQASQKLRSHPYAEEIDYRANLGSLRALGGEHTVNRAIESENDLGDRPWNLLDEKIRCRDGGPRKITEYTVVDCGTSAFNGDFVILEDGQGCRKQITTTEFDDIRL
ncbi:hypothetical protein JOM56_007528 [Amanita muscaria]